MADPIVIQPIDELLLQATAEGSIPCAVLCIGHAQQTLHRKAYGSRARPPDGEPADEGTVFDLASLTKPVACATSVLRLQQLGRLALTDRVADHLPQFGLGGKANVTVEQLLLHTGGLPPENPLEDCGGGRAAALENINQLPLTYEPGTHFEYSDLGYIVLGLLVDALDGRGLSAFASQEIFAPLGMSDTLFLPPRAVWQRCASTGVRAGDPIRGEVHDPRCHRLGGISGHAGLFSTAEDLTTFCRMILGRGVDSGRRHFSEAMVAAMTTPQRLPGGGMRTYAFDVATRFSSPWSERFAAGTAMGHTGFTGTMLWICPGAQWFVVFLTNAVDGTNRDAITILRRRLMDCVADAIASS